mmetsp:Transcript_27861/g.74342  ORF Transcript_27861/g.74342 Transcript_27861/m.74342 type:complete len:320 (+) Transcript_27861:583-1542(+)
MPPPAFLGKQPGGRQKAAEAGRERRACTFAPTPRPTEAAPAGAGSCTRGCRGQGRRPSRPTFWRRPWGAGQRAGPYRSATGHCGRAKGFPMSMNTSIVAESLSARTPVSFMSLMSRYDSMAPLATMDTISVVAITSSPWLTPHTPMPSAGKPPPHACTQLVPPEGSKPAGHADRHHMPRCSGCFESGSHEAGCAPRGARRAETLTCASLAEATGAYGTSIGAGCAPSSATQPELGKVAVSSADLYSVGRFTPRNVSSMKKRQAFRVWLHSRTVFSCERTLTYRGFPLCSPDCTYNPFSARTPAPFTVKARFGPALTHWW